MKKAVIILFFILAIFLSGKRNCQAWTISVGCTVDYDSHIVTQQEMLNFFKDMPEKYKKEIEKYGIKEYCMAWDGFKGDFTVLLNPEKEIGIQTPDFEVKGLAVIDPQNVKVRTESELPVVLWPWKGKIKDKFCKILTEEINKETDRIKNIPR